MTEQPPFTQSNSTDQCTDDSQCFRGLCFQSTCYCEPLWGGQTCNDYLLKNSQPLSIWFMVHWIFFAACFATIFILCFIQLVALIRNARPKSSVNKPSVFIFSFLCFISLIRVVALLVDPYLSRGFFPTFLGELLFSLGYWGISSVLMLVVCLWLGAYLKTKIKSKKIIQRVYNTCIATIVVLFALTFVEAAVFAYAPNIFVRWGFFLGYAIFVLVFAATISSILLHYARLFSKVLNTFKQQKHRKKLIRKINRFAITIAILLLGTIVLMLTIALFIYFLRFDAFFYLLGITVQRSVEVLFCFVVWGTYKKNLKDNKGLNQDQDSSLRSQSLVVLPGNNNNIVEQKTKEDSEQTHHKEPEHLQSNNEELRNEEQSPKNSSSRKESSESVSSSDDNDNDNDDDDDDDEMKADTRTETKEKEHSTSQPPPTNVEEDKKKKGSDHESSESDKDHGSKSDSSKESE